MTKEKLEQLAAEFIGDSCLNRVSGEKALRRELEGMKIYQEALFGYTSAEDSYLGELKASPPAGVPLEPPSFWLGSARTVVSFFLPFTDTVRLSNRKNHSYPSQEWLHGRIDGQAFVMELSLFLQRSLEREGFEAVVPPADPRFWSNTGFLNTGEERPLFTSNWSERHVAYACGLGTFSLSKGLITSRGMAGRLGSLITSLELSPTARAYTGLYDYCIQCGACVKRCPVEAISPEQGKSHRPCSDFLDKVLSENDPYYGCGKCQTAVPCEVRIPAEKYRNKEK